MTNRPDTEAIRLRRADQPGDMGWVVMTHARSTPSSSVGTPSSRRWWPGSWPISPNGTTPPSGSGVDR